MKTNQNNQQYDEIKYILFCNELEKQYKNAKEEGLFEVLKVLELDKEHSDSKLVQAVDYFNEKGGAVEKDAPIDFFLLIRLSHNFFIRSDRSASASDHADILRLQNAHYWRGRWHSHFH